jgi:hypothetical protein
VLNVHAQIAAAIPADAAAAHIGEYATVEGVVANVFASKNGKTFLNIGAAYPNQTFTGWLPPASPASNSPILADIEAPAIKSYFFLSRLMPTSNATSMFASNKSRWCR